MKENMRRARGKVCVRPVDGARWVVAVRHGCPLCTRCADWCQSARATAGGSTGGAVRLAARKTHVWDPVGQSPLQIFKTACLDVKKNAKLEKNECTPLAPDRPPCASRVCFSAPPAIRRTRSHRQPRLFSLLRRRDFLRRKLSFVTQSRHRLAHWALHGWIVPTGRRPLRCCPAFSRR